MYPKFLCIGAQKSGTSWLQANMQTHPGIWLPPIKEVHYLDDRTSGVFKSLFSSSKRARKGRAYLGEQLRALPRGGNLSELRWALHYNFAPRSDAWYSALFPEIPGKITGEICPGYARIRGDGVARVHRLMPDAKIVYFIRNPVDRAWSYANQYFTSPRSKGSYGGPDKVPADVLQAFLRKDSTGHSDFLGALDAWERYYGKEQMLVCFFDDLAADPLALFRRILDFVGADSTDQYLPATLGTNRNPSRGAGAGDQMRGALSKIHLEQLRGLDARLASPWTAKWLAKAEETLAADAVRVLP
jgi:hypothetical protein